MAERTARRPARAKIAPKRPDGRTLRAKRRAPVARVASARRQDIFDAAALLMQQRGFVGTTIEEVARQLELTKAALYYYVDNKEELLYQILSQTLTTAVERVGEIERSKVEPARKMREVVDTFVRLVADRPQFFTVYFQEKGHLAPEHLRTVTKTERRIVDGIERIYKEGAARGAFRKLDPTAAAFGVLGMCFWVYKWYRPDGRLSVEAVSEAFQAMALGGMLPEKRSTN